jgi:putative peptide zinc metalloprotease protein
MQRANDHHRSAAERTLPLRMRADLQVIEVAHGGDAAFVVKDPVAGESFHLTAEEYTLLDALREPASLRMLQRRLESQFAPRRASISQLQQFVSRLYEQGLLLGENPGQGAELLKRDRDRQRVERRMSWLQLLSIRLGGVDAGLVIDRLYSAVRWLCTPLALTAAGSLLVLAALLVLGNATELVARLPHIRELTRPGLIPMWIAAVIGVKILHELGHALACRHFGARPQEIGVLLLAGAPSLYCDVSDAWRLPSKWQRMAVSSAGMAVELVIAATAAIVWSYAAPGLLSTLCLSLIVVCSVGTLLVNANPLLRYDGYYLLADGLEVPNLADRARGLISSSWRQWLLDEPRRDDPLLGPHKRQALWIYAVLAKLYLALVLAGIFMLMLKLARPYQLQNLVYTLAVVAIAGMLMQPVMSAVKLMRNPAARSRFRWLRLVAACGVLAAVVGGVLMFPITRRVMAPLAIVPTNSHPLFAVTPGELEFALPAGAEVKAGEVVARLHNAQLETALAEQQGKVGELRTRLEQLRTLQVVQPTAARLIPAAIAELADAEAQLAERQSQVDSLTIRSPAVGRLLPPPDRVAEEHSPDKLGAWSGSPLDCRNEGAWIELGMPLAIVAEPGGWTAWAGVEQADVPAVEIGQSVRVVADDSPASILTGSVISVARRARSNESDRAANTSRFKPTTSENKYHVVQIEINDADAPLFAGARGTAKIDAYRSTVGALVLDELRRTFQRVF